MTKLSRIPYDRTNKNISISNHLIFGKSKKADGTQRPPRTVLQSTTNRALPLLTTEFGRDLVYS